MQFCSSNLKQKIERPMFEVENWFFKTFNWLPSLSMTMWMLIFKFSSCDELKEVVYVEVNQFCFEWMHDILSNSSLQAHPLCICLCDGFSYLWTLGPSNDLWLFVPWLWYDVFWSQVMIGLCVPSHQQGLRYSYLKFWWLGKRPLSFYT